MQASLHSFQRQKIQNAFGLHTWQDQASQSVPEGPGFREALGENLGYKGYIQKQETSLFS